MAKIDFFWLFYKVFTKKCMPRPTRPGAAQPAPWGGDLRYKVFPTYFSNNSRNNYLDLLCTYNSRIEVRWL